MAGALRTYSLINAKLRARLSKILPDEVLRQMARAPSLPECVQILANTEAAAFYKSLGFVHTGEKDEDGELIMSLKL